MEFWTILQIAPTTDNRTIKKAYAKLAKEYNPEERPQEFLQLRQAYEQALDYAKSNQPSPADQGQGGETSDETAPGPETGQCLEMAQDAAPRFTFNESVVDLRDGFDDCPALQKFRELYFNKKCKDRNLWLNYFTSPEFLEVAFEKGFVVALKNALAEESTIEKSFFSMLCLVYGLAQIPGRSREGNLGQPWLRFDGIEDIVEIVARGKTPYRIKGLDRAIASGYQDYVALRELTKSGQWNDHISYQFSALLDRYVSAYIYDTVPQDQGLHSAEYLPRHTSGLKLLNDYFAVTPLPKLAYAILWNKLDLKSAVMGRNKVFYGRLREIALEKVPELGEEPKESFAEFRAEFMSFSQEIYKQEDRQKIDQFFQREDLRRALGNQLFVESDVLRFWISSQKNAYFLQRLIDFCEQESGVVHRRRIQELATAELRWRDVKSAWEEDEQATAEHEDLTVEKRAFFRYLLHVAFARAYSSECSASLLAYLQENFPEAINWHRRMSRGEGKVTGPHNPPQFSVDLSGKPLQIVCQVRHLAYQFDEKPVMAPFIHFDMIAELPDETLFWLLLPVSFTHITAKVQVRETLEKRLANLEFLQGLDLVLLADAITGNVCKHYEESYFPECLKLRREHADVLYGCDIYPYDGTMLIHKNEPGFGDRVLREEALPPGDLDAALEMGNRLLNEFIEPESLDQLRVPNLPDTATANVYCAPLRHYEKEAVTQEVVKELLQLLTDDQLTRLELSWRYGGNGQSRSLVILRDQGVYACFCFDDRESSRHVLVGYPEIYNTVQCDEVEFVPFLYGQLESYNVHRSTVSILRNINTILQEVGDLRADMEDTLGLWSWRRNPDYHVDKCLLGGFPAAEVFTDLHRKFIIRHFPRVVETKDLEGNVKTTPIGNALDRMYVQEQLQAFMRQRLRRLQLTYELAEAPVEGENDRLAPRCYQVHLVLLHDEGSFMMVHLDEKRQALHYLVADVPGYKKLEGNKFKKTEFAGTRQRDHLVHQDLRRIRAYLDMLLPSIPAPERIFRIFGEFAYGFNSVKAKTYEECKEELLHL